MHVELVRKNNISVTLKKWSDSLWYFEVTKEIKDTNSDWYTCTTLKRTLPIYHLAFFNRILKGDRYKKFFKKKAEKLCRKYQGK